MPRNEMPELPEAKPLPKLFGIEPPPFAVNVCRYSPTVALPLRSISAAVMTCTGDAVSVSVRGMLEPVTTTLSSSLTPDSACPACWLSCACVVADNASRMATANGAARCDLLRMSVLRCG